MVYECLDCVRVTFFPAHARLMLLLNRHVKRHLSKSKAFTNRLDRSEQHKASAFDLSIRYAWKKRLIDW